MNIIIQEQKPSFKYKETQRIFGIENKDRVIFEFNDFHIPYDGITFINGCSGSGKTTLGKEIARKQGFVEVPKHFNKEIPIIDVFDKDFKDSLYFLNMVGLCEPFLYLTNYKNLSTGQQFRFDLAYTLSLGHKRIIIDEFCSYLDRLTAKVVSHNTQKSLRKFNISAILISAHSDLEEYLLPDNKITLSLDSEVNVTQSLFNNINRKISNPFLKDIVIEKGDYNDYIELEKYHYFDHSSEEVNESYNTSYYKLSLNGLLMGVIMLKNPYTNDQEADEFKELNSKVKVLSRIILHPIIRGAGLSKEFFSRVHELIKYKPIYVCSALAEYVPFFDKMGFTEIAEFNYSSDKEYELIENYKKDNSNCDKREVLKAIENMLSKVTYWQHRMFCSLIDKKTIYNENDFKGFFDGIYELQDIDWLTEEIKYFKMKHYIKK